jgi:FOG: WD40 repeat
MDNPMELGRTPSIAGAISALVACAALFGWSLWSGRRPGTEDFTIVRVAVGRSGSWLAAGTAAGRVAVWRLGGAPRPIQIRNDNGVLNDLQFSPDERWLAIANRGLTLFPLDNLNAPLVLCKDDKNYGAVSFSPDGKTILTITGSGIVELLNANRGGIVTSVCCSTIGGAVAFSPDGLFFLNAGHVPRQWEVRSGKLVTRLTREREFMLLGPIAFRDDAVLMGSQDGGIRVWDLRTHQSIGSSPRSSDWVDTIAVQERTGLVVYAGFGKTLRVWNPETDLRYSVMGVQPASNVDFSSPDGPLVVGRANGTVEFWDVQRGERQAVLPFPRNN